MACQERLSVGELASMTALSRPAVSHHIKILKQAGLLLEERDGTKRYYRPTFHDSVINLKALVDEIVQKSALNET
ncbi:HTH-type transcriptional regulator [compost metagenome]